MTSLLLNFIPSTHTQLRKINNVSFPIQYNEGFYQDVVNRNDETLNKFAYYNEFVVGALCARVEDADLVSGKRRLYIMTLAVLAAYRGRGIGSELLQSVLDYCDQQQQQQSAQIATATGGSSGTTAPSPSIPTISEIVLHVHVSNEDAIRFYTEKFGFVKGELVENYYRRIDPPHCYLLYKTLDPTAEKGTRSSEEAKDSLFV